MGLFDFNQTKEAVYVANLNKRHSDTAPKCTKCGSWAEWTNRAWCIDRACENFCPKALASYSLAKVAAADNVPIVDFKLTSSPVKGMPMPHLSHLYAPPRPDWALHNPTKQGAMVEHYTVFLAKLDEWSGQLVQNAPTLPSRHIHLEVSSKNIALNNPPFAPGAEFDILKILKKRPEWTPTPSTPSAPLRLGRLAITGTSKISTATYTTEVEVFVSMNLPSDVCSLSVGDWSLHDVPGYYMFIDLTSPHKTPPVNACATVGGYPVRSRLSKFMAATGTGSTMFHWPIARGGLTSDEHYIEFLKVADDAWNILEQAGHDMTHFRVEVPSKDWNYSSNAAFSMIRWIVAMPLNAATFTAARGNTNANFEGTLMKSTTLGPTMDVFTKVGLDVDKIMFSCGQWPTKSPVHVIYGKMQAP